MDIGVQTKITVLVEKINYLQHSIAQNNGVVSKVDKDLLVNYVRELYELVLSLPVNMPQYPTQGYNAPEPTASYPPYPQQNYQPNYPQTQVPQQNPSYPQPPLPSTPQQTAGTPPIPPSQKAGNELNASFTFSSGKRTLSDTIKIKVAGDKPSINENFKREDKDIASRMQLTPIKDLKIFISLNKRFSYINFLFGNDASLYDEAITYLNSCDSFETAKQYLNTYLQPKLNWADDNEMVTEFKTLVERRYIM